MYVFAPMEDHDDDDDVSPQDSLRLRLSPHPTNTSRIMTQESAKKILRYAGVSLPFLINFASWSAFNFLFLRTAQRSTWQKLPSGDRDCGVWGKAEAK